MAEIVFKNSIFTISCRALKNSPLVDFDVYEEDDDIIKNVFLEINPKQGKIFYASLVFDSKKVIEGNMNFDKNLTEKLIKDIQNEGKDLSRIKYDINWLYDWVEKQGYEVKRRGATHSDKEFVGDKNFFYILFNSYDMGDEYFAIIFWDEKPEVYKGWFDAVYFYLTLDEELQLEEIARLFGYEGNFYAMNKDFQRQYFEKCLNKPMSEYRLRKKIRF